MSRNLRATLEWDASSAERGMQRTAAVLDDTAAAMRASSQGAVDLSQGAAAAGRDLGGAAAQARKAAGESRSAGQQMRDFGSDAQEAGERTTSAWKRATTSIKDQGSAVAEHARTHKQEWTEAGGALTAYGAVVTGLAVGVAKVGIEYNQLRQRSLAALTTLLGSTEAAAAQMDRLDDFARNSPFSREVFITAQQQLIGFGRSAEEVVPILDAIQNAVAATGGSNADIAELAEIVARVGATGKLTAEDLNMMGRRGVDAATIIGEQMGVTGAEIRDSITRGTLDADEAIVALTQGMSERFGGAAANVKETFDGALDRVRAAIRDLAADLASPLVSPTGGGFLLDVLNWAADLLRWIEALPGPAKTVMATFAALTGVVALLAGGFLVLTPRILATRAAMQTLGATGAPMALRGLRALTSFIMGPWGLAFAVGATALTAWMSSQADSAARAQEFTDTLDEQTGAITRNTEARIMNQLEDEYKELTEKALQYGLTKEEVGAILLGNTDILQQHRDVLEEEYNAILASTGATDDDVKSRFEAVFAGKALNDSDMERIRVTQEVLNSLAAEGAEHMRLQEAKKEQIRNTNALTQSNMELAEKTRMWGRVSGAAGEQAKNAFEGVLQAGQDLATGAYDVLVQKHLELRDSMAEAHHGFIDYEGAIRASEEATRQWAEGQVEANDNAKKSVQDFVDEAGFNLEAYVEALEEQLVAQENWATNIDSLIGKVPEAFRQHLIDMGPQNAALVQAIIDDTEGELTGRYVDVFHAGGADASQAWADGSLSKASLFRVAAENLSSEMLAQLATDLEAGELTMGEIISKYDLEAEIRGELYSDPALEELARVIDEIAKAVGVAQVTADTSLALGKVEEFKFVTQNETGTVKMDADSLPAETKRGDWFRDVVDTTGVATLDANDRPAQSKRTGWLWDVFDSTGTTTMDANTQPARRKALDTVADIDSMGANVTVGTQLASDAYSKVRGLLGWASNLRTTVTVGIRQAFGFSSGGAVHGPGTTTSDSIDAIGPTTAQYKLSRDEHIWTAAETAAVGGHTNMYRLRKAALAGQVQYVPSGRVEYRATGGPVEPARASRYMTSPPVVVPAPAAAEGARQRPQQVIHVTANYPVAEPATERAKTFGEQFMAGAIGG